MARKAVQQRYFIAQQTPEGVGLVTLRLVEEQKDAAECRKRMKSQEFAEEHGNITNPLRVVITRNEPAMVLTRKASPIVNDIMEVAGDKTDEVVNVLAKHGLNVLGDTVATDMDAPIDLEAPQPSVGALPEQPPAPEPVKEATPPAPSLPAVPVQAELTPPPSVEPPPVGGTASKERDPLTQAPDDRSIWSRAQCHQCLAPAWYDTVQQKWFEMKPGYPEHVCAPVAQPTPPAPPGFPMGGPPVFGQGGPPK